MPPREFLTSIITPWGIPGVASLAGGFVSLVIAYYACLSIYRLYFHPLAKFPGPRLAAVGSLWMSFSYLGGRTPRELLELHNRYGPVVRTSPDELLFIDPLAKRQIYGHKAAGQPEFAKDEKYHSGLKGGKTIINADREYHGYLRKLMAHGFSDKSLRDQEAVLQQYVDLLFRRLHEVGRDGAEPLDISSWFNFMTFDFIGYLTFGESFNCLESSQLHRWVEVIFSIVKIMAISQGIARLPYPAQLPAKLLVIPRKVKSEVATLYALNDEKTGHRIEHNSPVPDFMDKLIDAHKSGKMDFAQLALNGQILTLAGSETTATALSGLTCLLLRHPRVRDRLTKEIRESFASPEEITVVRANQCKYLLACIEEILRIYPPSPQPHHRIIPKGGATVCGEYIPEGTAVAVPIYAAHMSPENWADPESFLPERWMDEDPRFANDKRDAFQPFSYGPRNCIGRNLAYVEMKLVLARLLWHFDIENATEGDWMDQKVYMVWEKSPLWVKLRPVQRG